MVLPASLRAISRQQLAAIAAMLLIVVPAALNGLYFPLLHRMGAPYFWAAELLQWLVAPALAYGIFLRPAGITLAQLGYRQYDASGRSITDSFGTMVLLTGALTIGTVLGNRILWRLFGYWSGSHFTYYQVIPESELLGPLVAIWFSLSAGFVEETTYRALPWYLMTTLPVSTWDKRRYLRWSSVVFALVHWEQGIVGVLSALFFGYCCGLFYANRRNIWPIIVAHAWFDLYCFWPD